MWLFSTDNLEEIKTVYDNWQVDNKIILTTEKDAARLYLHEEQLRDWGIKIVVLPIKVAVLFNKEDELNSIIRNYVQRTIVENSEVMEEGGE